MIICNRMLETPHTLFSRFGCTFRLAHVPVVLCGCGFHSIYKQHMLLLRVESFSSDADVQFIITNAERKILGNLRYV